VEGRRGDVTFRGLGADGLSWRGMPCWTRPPTRPIERPFVNDGVSLVALVGLVLLAVLVGGELELVDGLAPTAFGGGPEATFGKEDDEDPDEELLPLLRLDE
jgi:hypothetical protein